MHAGDPLPENDSTSSGDHEPDANRTLAKGEEFDEFEDHILDTTAPLDSPDPFDKHVDPSTDQQQGMTTPADILKAMRSLEKFGDVAEYKNKLNQVVTPRMKELFRSINVYIARIVQLTKHPEDANKFLEKDGFQKCVLPNMWIEYPEMRKNFLILTKQLLEVTPQTIKVIPIELLDQLLRIFDKDDDLNNKSLVVDILYIWLPGHPKVQARVMQLSGLNPFYTHLPKLNTNVVYNMIDLFNTLIKEHRDFRNNSALYSEEEKKLYQKIGLIQHISTRENCRGLLTIFHDAFQHNTKDNNILIPTLELMKLVQPTCTKRFKGLKKAFEFFTLLQNYISDKDNRKFLRDFMADADEIEAAINKYVEELKPKHVEL